MIVVEAYKVLRDRAPYPPDQIIKDLEGKFAFIIFDATSGRLFLARVSSSLPALCWFLEVICSSTDFEIFFSYKIKF